MNRHALFAIVGMTSLLVAGHASAGGGALYDLQADALDPQACGGQGCWTNHLRVTDLDGDGDLDILLANYSDFFGGSDDPEPLVIYTNDGSGAFTNNSSDAVGDHAGNHHQVAVGDVDGDGSPDIFGPNGNGGAYTLFINDGNGVFVDEADARLPGEPYPAGGAARFGDVDNDGDLDLYVSDSYSNAGPPYGHIYINDGAGVFEEAAGAIPEELDGDDIDDIEFFDADGDHDLDLVINPHNGAGAVWLNDGAGVFAASTTMDPPGAGSNFHYNVTPCDVDADGDLDLWIDNTGGSYTEQLLINDGAGNFADETSTRVTGGVNGSDDNGVVCADIDNDGDFDAVVIALGTAERFYENDGAGNFTFLAGVFPGPTDCSLWGEFGDLNGDGRIDLVTGQGECSSSDEVYFANDGVPADTTAPILRSIEGLVEPLEVDAESVVRFAVSDSTVTDEGPRLARAYVVVDPAGKATEVAAVAMGGDLFRAVIPGQAQGTLVFQLCAEDPQGNVGCSEDQQYQVGDGGGTESGTDTTADTTDGPDPTDPTDADTSAGDASASATVTDSASATNSASDSDSASGGSEDSTGTDTAGQDDDGGCSCDVGNDRMPAWFGLVTFGLVLARRRRAS